MREFNARTIPRPPLDIDPVVWRRFSHLDLEIGAGQGLHAIRYCQSHPERHLIALEKTHRRYDLSEGRLKAHSQIQNLSLFHADAVAFCVHFVPNEVLERVFILYPNPYPKSKHANLRWHNRPFISELKSKMKTGATLTMATNLFSYQEECAAIMTQEWGFQLLNRETVPQHSQPRTHFEKKYLARGETCWNLIFRKINLNK